MKTADPVNHPIGYNSHPSGIETIVFTRRMPFSPGNAVKYVMRRDFKGRAVEDIKKAIWYLKDAIAYGADYQLPPQTIELGRRVSSMEKNDHAGEFYEIMLAKPYIGITQLGEALVAIECLLKEYEGEALF